MLFISLGNQDYSFVSMHNLEIFLINNFENFVDFQNRV